MPPVTVSPWRSLRMADRYSPVCPQHFPDIAPSTVNETESQAKYIPTRGRLEALKKMEPFLVNQSEDCLYLNIFTPYSSEFFFFSFFFSFFFFRFMLQHSVWHTESYLLYFHFSTSSSSRGCTKEGGKALHLSSSLVCYLLLLGRIEAWRPWHALTHRCRFIPMAGRQSAQAVGA